jgi:hypothetical protein
LSSVLSPCALFDAEVENGSTPNDDDYPTWVQAAIEAQLGETLDAKKLVWEDVLALWRLKLSEEEGWKDGVRQQHVSAWLVRSGFPESRER